MVGQMVALQPLLAGVTGAFQHLSLQWLTLHKGVAKLGYIVTSLLSGVVQEGYCTATEQAETEGGEVDCNALLRQATAPSFALYLLLFPSHGSSLNIDFLLHTDGCKRQLQCAADCQCCYCQHALDCD